MDAFVHVDIPDEIECRILEAKSYLDLGLAMIGPYAGDEDDEAIFSLSIRKAEDGLEAAEQAVYRKLAHLGIDPREGKVWLGYFRLHFSLEFEATNIPDSLALDEEMLSCLIHFLSKFFDSINPAILVNGCVIESDEWGRSLKRVPAERPYQFSLN